MNKMKNTQNATTRFGKVKPGMNAKRKELVEKLNWLEVEINSLVVRGSNGRELEKLREGKAALIAEIKDLSI
ncbi:hypothetical protein [Escherichia phage C6]|nr:hypothetical protein [Escherichia phage C6]